MLKKRVDYTQDVSFGDREAAGAHLREVREQAGMRQQDVAAALGCSVPFVSNMERGRTPVKPVYVLKLAELYDMAIADFARVMLRYRDPVTYYSLFGNDGDEALTDLVSAFVAKTFGKEGGEP